MVKFIACSKRGEFFEAAGFDWAKVIRVDGGYIGFETIYEYKNWKNSK